jgi:Acyl-CoA reductase (LuxC)
VTLSKIELLEKIELLFGDLDELVKLPAEEFISNDCINFLNKWSAEIFQDPRVKDFPDVATFAFWIRKSSIEKIKASHLNNNIMIGRGITFHIAPSNVPINFAFSAVFGLISGNSSIVRIPTRKFEQVEIIIDSLKKISDEYKKRLIFFRSSRDNEVSGFFSMIADARLIWGSDATIKEIKSLPGKIRQVDLVFSDRYSIALLNSHKIISCDEEELLKVAKNFYNDVFLFDQNACSSPRLIIWLGNEIESEKAKEVFWEKIDGIVEKKYNYQEMFSIEKFKEIVRAQTIDIEDFEWAKMNSGIDRISLRKLVPTILDLNNHFGLFLEYTTKDIDELLAVVDPRMQTCTYFGFERYEILQIAKKMSSRGIDRWVNLGMALDIHEIWDGYNIPSFLTRTIELN